MKNFLLGLLCTIFVILFFAIVYFCIISKGELKQFTDGNGNILPDSISRREIIEVNGAKNGLIIQGKNRNNPVLLFVSSGPGSDDYFFNELYPDMNLSDYYTVCYWNYRGMGTVYDKSIDPETITTEILIEDTRAVTELLKREFNQDKIYIMGFSGGTHISLQTVHRYPENYYALFQMAQVVCSNEDNDTLVYDFMKKVFSEKGDLKRLKKLEKEVEHLDSGKVRCVNWPSFVYLLHEAGGGTLKNKNEFWGIDVPIFMNHSYTIKEKLNYVPGLKMYRKSTFSAEMKTVDYRKDIKELQIPVYFISGDYDYNCPWPLVKEYSDLIVAPDKDFLLVSDAAHSPLWENSKTVIDFMKSKININK